MSYQISCYCRETSQVRVHIQRCVTTNVVETFEHCDLLKFNFDVMALECHELNDYCVFYHKSNLTDDRLVDNMTIYQSIIRTPSVGFLNKYFPEVGGQRVYKFYDTVFLSNSNSFQTFFKIFNVTQLSSDYLTFNLLFNFASSRAFSTDLPIVFLSRLS